MSSERKCPACGRPLAADAPEELCPACLIKAGFDTGLAPEPGQPGQPRSFVPPAIAELAGLFPQLEIQKLLGQGGMGAVYRARQPALDRLVALKILPPQTSGDAGFAERFTREARALARLNHPNIVGVHDFGVAGGLHYFVMEYVEGLNLRQVQQAGKLSPCEALKVIPQICDALQFAHDEGVVHRDIKPENIMLDKKGRVKITDFGLAKILGRDAKGLRLTGAQEVMGTPHYMAPEQIEHPQTVDHRADIYSLGVVFYEMLTGELPLGKFQPPSRKVQVDVRLDEVVLHALEKEPERRYQQVSQVKKDVETIVSRPAPGPGGQTLGALEARPRKRLQLRRWPVLAVLLVSMVAVITLITFVTRPRQKSLGTALQTTDLQWPETPAIADSKTPMIQDERLELFPDGVARFRLHVQELNNSGTNLQTFVFINSDFMSVTNMTDAQHHPIAFTKTHEPIYGGIFRYSVTLNEPVPPGQPVSTIGEGTMTGRVKPTGAPGVFEYSMRHRPVGQQRTRRIEWHRLPPGASLLEKQPNDLHERVRDGRIELFIDRLIPPGDSLEIVYRFRLDQSEKNAPIGR
jgi:serine/threonine protein kinase